MTDQKGQKDQIDHSSQDDKSRNAPSVRPGTSFSMAHALDMVRRRKEAEEQAKIEKEKSLEDEKKEKARAKRKRRRQNQKIAKAKLKKPKTGEGFDDKALKASLEKLKSMIPRVLMLKKP